MSRLNADIALLAAAVWGVAFLFQKSAMDHVGPLAFVAARCALAAVALAPLAWREHRRGLASSAPGPAFWATAGLGGAAFFAAAWLQQVGLRTATVTNTGFLTALYVVITPFIAWAWTGKAPAAPVWPAVGLSTLGTWLLGGGGMLAGLGRGDWLVALCAVFWALHAVVTGSAARFARPVGFTAIQFAVVAALAVLGSAAAETTTLAGLAAAAPEIAYVGLLSTALTFTLLTVALQYTPPAEAAVIISTETVFAALAAHLALGERLPASGWIGAGLILLATLMLQVGLARAARDGAPPTATAAPPDH